MNKKIAIYFVAILTAGALTGCSLNSNAQEQDPAPEHVEMVKEGMGTFVGMVDGHSVEIEVNGETKKFQLTDEAKQQASSLTKGAEVSFVYTETEIELATIEKFN